MRSTTACWAKRQVPAVLDDVITLIGESFEKDAYGVEKPKESRREIFCQVGSITRQEFFQAGRNGLNPEYVFTVFAADYNGERTCAYRYRPYAIYRSYRVPGTDYMELYVERKGGTNGVNIVS